MAQNNALKEWMGENGVWVYDKSDWGVGPHALSVAVSSDEIVLGGREFCGTNIRRLLLADVTKCFWPFVQMFSTRLVSGLAYGEERFQLLSPLVFKIFLLGPLSPSPPVCVRMCGALQGGYGGRERKRDSGSRYDS